jgi:hypothetical protein
MSTYKGIEFAKGYNKSFAEFKEEFGFTHIFNNIHPSEREKELRKAYKNATDGNPSGTTNKSKEAASQKPAK